MNIEITRAQQQDTPVLRQLYELYCHDFSEFMPSDVNATGMFTDDQFLTGYWREPNWSAYLIRCDDHLAGFAWVLKTTLFPPAGLGESKAARKTLADAGLLAGTHILMEEFFVMRHYRRRGVGEHVARYLFDHMPGVWEVSEIDANTPAQAFWRRIIDRYTGGAYTEVRFTSSAWSGPVQVFKSLGGSTGELAIP
ncbi:MAG TPA: GNAT family N-acetyltransferase [Anaerolineae bacterium]